MLRKREDYSVPIEGSAGVGKTTFYLCRYGNESRFRLFFFLCFHVPFVHGHVRSGYEVMPALHLPFSQTKERLRGRGQLCTSATVLQGDATHFGFYSRVLLTVCVSICQDCCFIKPQAFSTFERSLLAFKITNN